MQQLESFSVVDSRVVLADTDGDLEIEMAKFKLGQLA